MRDGVGESDLDWLRWAIAHRPPTAHVERWFTVLRPRRRRAFDYAERPDFGQ
jgi:hypothetical protein